MLGVFGVFTKIKAERANQSIVVDFNLFAVDIFEKVTIGKNENVIFSPVSIQTCLALAFFGAEGNTKEELRTILRLGNQTPSIIAERFQEFMENTFKNSNDAIMMYMANRIYVRKSLQVKSEFNRLAKKAFQSKAQRLNFNDSAAAVNKINTFVRKQTKYNIKEIINESSIDKRTNIVFVNAIYFQGKWEIPFNSLLTRKLAFNVNKETKVEVDTMHMDESVQYGEFPDLDAKVLELRYAKSNLAMLFLLPNAVDGLENMERKLLATDFNEISSKLEKHKVDVYIPKFRIEHNLDLIKPLKSLGLKIIFTEKANFNGLLDNAGEEKVSQVKHKAFIDVNEAGTKAAAATGK